MRTGHVLSALLTLALVAGAPAAAQDTGRAGLAMGYPASVGLIWHVSGRLALRPEVNLSKTSTETTPVQNVSDSWSAGFGVSGLLYVKTIDKLRTYLSPKVSYARRKVTAHATGSSSTAGTTYETWSASGAFGAQYSLSDRFGVFGEVGLGYTHQKSSLGPSSTAATSWGTQTGVGVLFYF